jgi:hypothetical protein
METIPWMFALVGTCVYGLLFQPDWRNPYLLLYDVPTVPVAFAFAGENLQRLASGDTLPSVPRLIALALAVLLAAGAQYRAWRLSGHLTVATTIAALIVTDPNAPLCWRWSVLLPVLILLWIRLLHPQSMQMGNRCNTVSALLLGLLLALTLSPLPLTP